jgi:hypothetical protein
VTVKHSLRLVLSLGVFGLVSVDADDILPPRFNFDRYTAMVDHSPFAIATAVALPTAMSDFAKDLYLANAARSPDGDMATIASSSDQNFKKYLTTREPVDGYSIASIEWSDKVGETKVTISKDGKFATITFNQALLSQPLPHAPTAVVASPLKPPPVSRQAPRPHVRGVIEQNPKTVPTPAPAVGQPTEETMMPPGGMTRKLQEIQRLPPAERLTKLQEMSGLSPAQNLQNQQQLQGSK